jgi:hypothetical protein
LINFIFLYICYLKQPFYEKQKRKYCSCSNRFFRGG